jgi:hypothetical protein
MRPTCRPMCATSSMSWLPSGYHGSITQSWPHATLTPAASSSSARCSLRSTRCDRRPRLRVSGTPTCSPANRVRSEGDLSAPERARERVQVGHSAARPDAAWPAFLPDTQGAGYAPRMAPPRSARRRAAPASPPRGRVLPEEAQAMFLAGRRGGEARKRALSAAERSARARRAVTARWSRRRPRAMLALSAGDGRERGRSDHPRSSTFLSPPGRSARSLRSSRNTAQLAPSARSARRQG